jgi:hypothetical protein
LGKIGVLVNFIVQELKFCKIAQLLIFVIFVSVSLVRENVRGLRGNLKHKIPTLKLHWNGQLSPNFQPATS